VDAEFDRRGLLLVAGSLSLAALISACTDARTAGTAGGGAPPPAPTSSAASSTSAATGPTAPRTPSPVGLLADASTCVLTRETIAGPTWFDAHAVRRDIRDDRPGVPLDLAFRVVQMPACAPVAGAVVDLWQCDALGGYSGFAGAAPGDGGRPDGRDRYGDAQAAPTAGDRWLRGTQLTGADGIVQFTTVYPGWYPTRTVHLHLKVHLDETTRLTTQLFFDDAVSDAVHAGLPYQQHPGRDTRNERDAFYSPTAVLRLAPDGDRWLGAIGLGVS
jgi:protocatechuate 3,4-dioxygenase beta subunit